MALKPGQRAIRIDLDPADFQAVRIAAAARGLPIKHYCQQILITAATGKAPVLNGDKRWHDWLKSAPVK